MANFKCTKVYKTDKRVIGTILTKGNINIKKNQSSFSPIYKTLVLNKKFYEIQMFVNIFKTNTNSKSDCKFY